MTRITLWNAIGWIFGCLFALAAIGGLISGAIFSAIIYLIVACIMIPPAIAYIEEKIDIELSGGMKIALIVMLVIIAGACMPDVSTSQNIDDVNDQVSTSKSAEIASTPVVAPYVKQWHDIAQWSGSGTKNTETFTIPSQAKEWKISWVTKPSPTYGDFNFQIFVYKPDSGMPVSVAANIIGANTDSTIMRGAGDYYLTINTAQPYTIEVEAKY